MMKKTKQINYTGLRVRCIELNKEGKTQKEIKAALGVAQSAISRWIKLYKIDGEKTLEYPSIGGSKRRISPEQQEGLASILLEGAVKKGFEGNFWTHQRIAKVIEEEYGIKYQKRAIGYILLGMNFSLQIPRTKNYKQDEKKVEEWKEKRLPDLKKKLKKKDML